MFDNLREIWERQTASAKALLALGTLLILAALIYLSYAVLRPNYQVLFSDLDPQDAATIVAELDKMKIAYRPGGDETSILVDARQVHSTRLKLMGKGHLRHLPVIDDGKLVGLLSVSNLVKAVLADQAEMIQQLEQYIRGQ